MRLERAHRLVKVLMLARVAMATLRIDRRSSSMAAVGFTFQTTEGTTAASTNAHNFAPRESTLAFSSALVNLPSVSSFGRTRRLRLV